MHSSVHSFLVPDFHRVVRRIPFLARYESSGVSGAPKSTYLHDVQGTSGIVDPRSDWATVVASATAISFRDESMFRRERLRRADKGKHKTGQRLPGVPTAAADAKGAGMAPKGRP